MMQPRMATTDLSRLRSTVTCTVWTVPHLEGPKRPQLPLSGSRVRGAGILGIVRPATMIAPADRK